MALHVIILFRSLEFSVNLNARWRRVRFPSIHQLSYPKLSPESDQVDRGTACRSVDVSFR